MVDSQYLKFERHEYPGRKTPVVEVRSKSNRNLLGRIAWYGQWRQFCFMPRPSTIFNVGCMDDIKAQIAELMEERKAK